MKTNIKRARNPVNQYIRTLRLEQGWSLEEVALKLKISTPALSKIETGLTDVNLSRLEQIAHIYGISTVKLLNSTVAVQKSYLDPNYESLTQIIIDRGEEIVELQKKVIFLYEELRNANSTLHLSLGK